MRKKVALGLFVGAMVMLVAQVQVASAVAVGQVDDFEDGTVMGWSNGASSPVPPVNIPNGGPAGAGDNYLENDSNGGGGAGSAMTMYNRTQWTGDYLGEGVVRLEAYMANFGATALSMRIAIEGNPSDRYGSITGVPLPADGQWHHVLFNLDAADLGLISGGASLNDVLSNVTELRILSAATGPSWRGDAIVASLGVDDLTAFDDTVPTVSEWGLVVMTLLLLTAGTWVLMRRRPSRAGQN